MVSQGMLFGCARAASDARIAGVWGGIVMAARPDRGGRFGRWLAVGTILAGLAVMLAVLPSRGVGSAQADRPLKVVVHVNFAQTTHQKQGLGNVENILKAANDQGIKAEVEIVCHGEGLRLVEKARTELAGEVTALSNQGVRFVACENTMRQRSLGPDDLLPVVGTVPSGAFEVVRRQQDGFAYFKP
jgi:intracellular sulfur oxidation DsrE/DsrF family protein